MEPGGSMLHSQGLCNNPYPDPNQSNSLFWYRFILDPKGTFLVGLPVKILKALLPSSILVT